MTEPRWRQAWVHMLGSGNDLGKVVGRMVRTTRDELFFTRKVVVAAGASNLSAPVKITKGAIGYVTGMQGSLAIIALWDPPISLASFEDVVKGTPNAKLDLAKVIVVGLEDFRQSFEIS